MNEDSKLLCCPCGGKAKLKKYHGTYVDGFYVTCQKCHSCGDIKYYKGDAIKAWNRWVTE